MNSSFRLDQLLHERQFFDSREKAQRSILAGRVLVNGQVVSKAGAKIAAASKIEITQQERYVGRGGHKLEGALKHFLIDPTGWECLDLGASTGGFTDCLLQHGAKQITAVDVGKGQLAWSLRQDPRVQVHEGINARYLEKKDFLTSFDLIVADLSFISLTRVLPAAFQLLKSTGCIIVLIKPQFELSQREVGRGGIVRDPEARQKAVASIRTWTEQAGHHFEKVMESPLPGTRGNIEFLALLRPSLSSLLPITLLG